MQCPKCNFELPDDLSFCPICGATFESAGTSTTNDTSSAPVQNGESESVSVSAPKAEKASSSSNNKIRDLLVKFGFYVVAGVNILVGLIALIKCLSIPNGVLPPRVVTVNVMIAIFNIAFGGLSIYNKTLFDKKNKLLKTLLPLPLTISLGLIILEPILLRGFVVGIGATSILRAIFYIAMLILNLKYIQPEVKNF